MRTRKIIKRVIINLFLLTSAFLLQTSIFPFIPYIETSPNFLLILTSSFGFIYGSTTGILCGLYAGFLMDMFYSVPYGFFVLVFIYIGFLNGLFTNYYYDDYLTLPVILCVASELFYNAAMTAIRYFSSGSVNIGYSVLHIVIPETLFALLITVLLYQVFLRANRSLDIREDKRGQNVA